MNSSIEFPNKAKAAVIIKAAPDIGRVHGETVCVAGIDYDGNWHRLYPVPFKDLEQEQKFGRWDVLEFDWRKAPDDDRIESKRINPQTIKKSGSVKQTERHAFARRALVNSLDEQLDQGKSFALIRPINPRFVIEEKSEDELSKERTKRASLLSQDDMFSETIIPKEPAPYWFKYRFEFDGKPRNYKCIDWETEATFFKWRNKYGDAKALDEMKSRFGLEWPAKGIAFAMGTHRNKAWKNWLLSGILRVDHEDQPTFL